MSIRKELSTTNASAPGAAPRCLGVQQAALYLGATVWAVRKLAWERKLPFIRLGQRLLFDRLDLDKYIEEVKVPARL